MVYPKLICLSTLNAAMLKKLFDKANTKLAIASRNYVRRQGFVVSLPMQEFEYKVGFLDILSKYFLRQNDFFFVQIGANDGKSFDALYEFVTDNKVKGIVIEPVNDYFNELVKNYREFPLISPVNAALHPTLKEATIYRVDPARESELPEWTRGIASFDPEHHKKSRTKSEVIVEETVRCISWNELLSTYCIEKIDLLQIDTEGFDLEILKMVDWNAIRPMVVRFEHESLSHADREIANTLMRNQGYKIWCDEQDTVAVLHQNSGQV